MLELLRLKIPRGWAILDNKFYDLDPKVEQDSNLIINPHEGFIEDVLWIQECFVKDGKFEIPYTNCFSIDIGWYPDSDATGQYCATLGWCGMNDLIDLEKFESKNRFEIQNRIEFWMADIKNPSSFFRKKMNI